MSGLHRQTAAALMNDMGLLAAATWLRTEPVERLEIERAAPLLAQRLGLMADLAVEAGVDLDAMTVSQRPAGG